jgi:superfamily II DNA or RNA helicase
MKAVLSNRIYIQVNAELFKKLDAELTYTIPSYNVTEAPIVIKNMGLIRDDLVTLPSGRMDLIPEDYEVTDKRVLNPVDFPERKFELYPSQQEVHDLVNDSCIINASVSWGKTFTALAIAGKLGQKTLVVTHTTNLRDQWADEVEKIYGFRPGIIGGGKFNLEGQIVVGNVQTLYKKINQISREFGTLILDEMHHVSSPTFSRIVDKNFARYKIGLSGTIQRKDGKHVVFRDYFSDKIYQPPKENYMVPKVDVITSEIRFMDGANIPWANRVNDLALNEQYQHTVAMIAAAYAAKGHRVLVLSDRVRFLKSCAELVGDSAVSVTGALTREARIKAAKQISSGEKQILFGTQSIFSEGISINELSCLVLGTPVNNTPLLTQLIGRIVRLSANKLQPTVVDIHLRGRTALRQAQSRMEHYVKEGYIINVL